MLLSCGISASAQEFVLNEQIRREAIEKAQATLMPEGQTILPFTKTT
jgi:hypothetical protein